MKFSIGWLKDHLRTDANVDDITRALTDLGLEVDSVECAADNLKHLKVGEILSAQKHPQADKLKVCLVATSEGERQVICGAPNARAGIKVVVAQPGDYVPGIDTKISVGRIRGIDSYGMMCSEKELQISEEHDGIIELDASAKVGEPVADLMGLNDPVIQISITPNRPDALGVKGIARDLQAKGIGRVIEREIEPIPGTFLSPIKVSLNSNVAKKDCTLFIGRYFRDVKNGPSPSWLQERLKAIGLRPISALVDITNYLTYDQNRPLHVFDADKVTGNLEVRKAKKNEKLLALDEREYNLDETMTVIADANGAESIGGIMGGMESSCTSDTSNVFLEAAFFDAISTAKTGRKLKIESDARYRFERGIDPEFTEKGIEMASKLILECCGGELSEVVIAGSPPESDLMLTLDTKMLETVVGMTVDPEQQCKILKDLGFEVKGTDPYQITAPSWRPDITGDIDLLEEISRVVSLKNLIGKPFDLTGPGIPKPVLTKMQKRVSVMRRAFTIEGYDECITYSFIDKASAELFSLENGVATITNPISSEMTEMRPSIIPGLLMAAAKNQHRGAFDLRLFEIGSSFNGDQPNEEFLEASGVMIGNFLRKNSYEDMRFSDFFDIKSHVMQVLDRLNLQIDRMTFKRTAPKHYHPQRSAQIFLGPKILVGEIGEIHPTVIQNFDLKGPVHAFSIFPENIPIQASKSTGKKSLKTFDLPSATRDFSFIIDQEIEVSQLISLVYSVDKILIHEVFLFDIFDGVKANEQFGSGKKSIAFSVKFQPLIETLKDAEIEALSKKIIKVIEDKTGGNLRN